MRKEILRKLKIRKQAMENKEYGIDKKEQKSSHLKNLEYNLEQANRIKTVDYDFPIHSHRKTIGKIIVLYKRAVRKLLKWYIKDTGVIQNNVNSYLVQAIYEMKSLNEEKVYQLESTISEMKVNIQQLETKLEDNMQQLETKLEDNMRQLETKLEDNMQQLETKLEGNIEQLEIKLEDDIQAYGIKQINIDAKIEEVKVKLDAIEETWEENKEEQNLFKTKVEDIKEQISYNAYQIKALGQQNKYLGYKLKNVNSNDKLCLNESNARQINSEKNNAYNIMEFDYFRFENRFRGPEELIKDRLERFITYYKGKENVLDIGCGRGEFLELLRENNITAKGIDIEEEFVNYCSFKQLQVQKVEAIEYLLGVEDYSLGGVFISQVIEHLSVEYLQQLIPLCIQKMKENAYLIVETPNPKTLGIYVNSFYMDPTHSKPIHPEYLKYLMEESGVINIKEEYSSPIREIKTTYGECSKEVAEVLNDIEKLLYGYQDYALICKK